MCFTLRLCAWQFVIEWTPQLSSESRHASIKIAPPPSVPFLPLFQNFPPGCHGCSQRLLSSSCWICVDSAIVLGTCTIKVDFGSHVRCFIMELCVCAFHCVISPSSDYARLRPPPLFTPSCLFSPPFSISHLHVHTFLMEHHSSCCTPMDGIHRMPLSWCYIWLSFDMIAYEDHIPL